MESSPASPQMESFPSPPLMVSAPKLPRSESAPELSSPLPGHVSAPIVPVHVAIACSSLSGCRGCPAALYGSHRRHVKKTRGLRLPPVRRYCQGRTAAGNRLAGHAIGPPWPRIPPPSIPDDRSRSPPWSRRLTRGRNFPEHVPGRSPIGAERTSGKAPPTPRSAPRARAGFRLILGLTLICRPLPRNV